MQTYLPLLVGVADLPARLAVVPGAGVGSGLAVPLAALGLLRGSGGGHGGDGGEDESLELHGCGYVGGVVITRVLGIRY